MDDSKGSESLDRGGSEGYELVWASSESIDSLYLDVLVGEWLGIRVLHDAQHQTPVLMVCSLFDGAEEVFEDGRFSEPHAVSIETLKSIVADIEAEIARRPLRGS